MLMSQPRAGLQLMLPYQKGSSATNLGTRPILVFVTKKLQPELTMWPEECLGCIQINMNHSFYLFHFSSHLSFSVMCITMSPWQCWQIYHIYRPQTKFGAR